MVVELEPTGNSGVVEFSISSVGPGVGSGVCGGVEGGSVSGVGDGVSGGVEGGSVSGGVEGGSVSGVGAGVCCGVWVVVVVLWMMESNGELSMAAGDRATLEPAMND